MKSSIKKKLEFLVDRHEEIGVLLSTPSVIGNQNEFRELSKEYAELEPVVSCFKQYQEALQAILSAMELQKDADLEIQQMAEEELKEARLVEQNLSDKLSILLLPKDPSDSKNIFLEIRAGTGGDEAAIFVGDLFRMYSRYAERNRWQVEIISENEAEQGGYKEIILRVIGDNVYSCLKFESGAHRVQRVPVTESQGRIHTSACTVAVMPEADEVSDVDMDPSDLRIDTYRASGAGGQHVNKTDSAIRITHVPTGIVVECQDERSQHKNRAKAMVLLRTKLLTSEQDKQKSEISETRKNLVGSGDRSERIRTYNFPQGRVTDHRINLTLYKLDEIMDGNIKEITDALRHEYQASLLADLEQEQ